MSSLTEKQRHELRKFVKELQKHKGRHTELVSVYIPADYEMVKILNHLAQEQGTATNIKSTSTRKNVTDALERMIQHLRLFKQTPKNGLAAFSGNIAEREGQSDVKVWSIEPPVPLKIRLYRCDKLFVTDIIEDMLDIKEVYGLVVLDRRDAIIAYLKGKTIIPLLKTHSEVPGKYKAGGQSAASRVHADPAGRHLRHPGPGRAQGHRAPRPTHGGGVLQRVVALGRLAVGGARGGKPRRPRSGQEGYR